MIGNFIIIIIVVIIIIIISSSRINIIIIKYFHLQYFLFNFSKNGFCII